MVTVLHHRRAIILLLGVIVFLGTLSTPALVGAQDPGDCRDDADGVVTGLVPCGCDTNDDGVVSGEERCGFNDILQLIQNIITWIILFTIPVAAIMFSYAGFLLISAQGDEGKIKQGKQVFTYVLTGFIFVLGAWLIVYTIASVLLDDQFLQFLNP